MEERNEEYRRSPVGRARALFEDVAEKLGMEGGWPLLWNAVQEAARDAFRDDFAWALERIAPAREPDYATLANPFTAAPDAGLIYKSVDGGHTRTPIPLEDVVVTLWWWSSYRPAEGPEGTEAAVVLLRDGTFACWEWVWATTDYLGWRVGAGLPPCTKESVRTVYVGRDLSVLVRAGLSDPTRRLLGVPERLWADEGEVEGR